MTEPQTKRQSYNWVPLIVLISGIIAFVGHDAGLTAADIWWDFAVAPFALFVLYVLGIVVKAVFTRGYR